MLKIMDLSSPAWEFGLSREPIAFDAPLHDTIALPSTVSQQKKSPYHEDRVSGNLGDPYAYEGYALYRRAFVLENVAEADWTLTLERTRTSRVWLNGVEIGTQNSLCAPHVYDVTTALVEGENTISILVDNVSCPIPGGHMTSKDTQTNWLGVVGKLCLTARAKVRPENVRVRCEEKRSRIVVSGEMVGGAAQLTAAVEGFAPVVCEAEGAFSFAYEMPGAEKWSEHNPKLYTLTLSCGEDVTELSFGLRNFSTEGRRLKCNGERIFLRGKHDGLIFPLTGAAPMDKESWLETLRIAKEYGINHYRFHTCCPPEAAFEAADELGIYMEPELPFWGTIEETVSAGQQYCIDEGYRILAAYANHPSFMTLSMGNELWGSPQRINAILGELKAFDDRPLYTQGANNFQFTPCVLENEDYFIGVRFSRDRLIRGSYAMCDAPQGHIQVAAPNSSHDYDAFIAPEKAEATEAAGGTMEIQYGEGVKTVELTGGQEELIANVPVISHEIGQYFMYPDYKEIDQYTGVLKAWNLEIFRERMREAGLLHLADDYFRASGALAVDCYKREFEAALASNELSGFQVLDLQDFSGQGTALVGVLNALMQSNGLIAPEDWRCFCNDVVLLGCLDGFVHEERRVLKMPVKLFAYGAQAVVDPVVTVTLTCEGKEIAQTLAVKGSYRGGVFTLGEVELALPAVEKHAKARVELTMGDVRNGYDLWVFKRCENAVEYVTDWAQAKKKLAKGESVLFLPEKIDEERSIEGTYCADFWNYPMFNAISLSVGKKTPVGTLGLLIDKQHPALAGFPTETHSTAQWYDVVTASRAVKLDGAGLSPIVRTMDNCERNHDLATLFEANVLGGKLLVCTAPLHEQDSIACAALLGSLSEYVSSEKFTPAQNASIEVLDAIFA